MCDLFAGGGLESGMLLGDEMHVISSDVVIEVMEKAQTARDGAAG